LPGIAIGFLLTHARSGPTMLLGAALVGILTTALVEWLHRRGEVDTGASMGVIFTILFAIGIIIIRFTADAVDLDPGCVLYGALEYAPFKRTRLLGLDLPSAAVNAGGVLVCIAVFVSVFFKELKITTFDPALATTLGFHAQRMHYALMSLVAVATVAAFESVGSILVIAMLIVPAAAAHLLTEKLGMMLILSAALALFATIAGHFLAVIFPNLIGYPKYDTNIAGMMSVSAGAIFLCAFLFSPRHGLIVRALRNRRLTGRIVGEDILLFLKRTPALAGNPEPGRSLPDVHQYVQHVAGISPRRSRALLSALERRGVVSREGNTIRLTLRGRQTASDLLRKHRLWETYLDRNLAIPSDHVHDPADRLEHITDHDFSERLASDLDHPVRDPQGKPINPSDM
ncbi:MAG: metal ABC transporter permease, partial [Phycisphaerae bacterium]